MIGTFKVIRRTGKADDIQPCRLIEMSCDVGGLVVVRVEADAALLSKDSVVMAPRIERDAGKITFHGVPRGVVRKTPASIPKRT